MSAYQSPIVLDKTNVIYIHQDIEVCGENEGAIFDPIAKVYNVQDIIIIEIDCIKYRMVEYHFHVPAEHSIHNTIYPAEIHYVFNEINNISNVLVIGKAISNISRHVDLSKLQIRIPEKYFEYDGSLTTASFSPAKWIFDYRIKHLNIQDIIQVAQTAIPLQPLDGRIILFGNDNFHDNGHFHDHCHDEHDDNDDHY